VGTSHHIRIKIYAGRKSSQEGSIPWLAGIWRQVWPFHIYATAGAKTKGAC
jgi:hypothetical protein